LCILPRRSRTSSKRGKATLLASSVNGQVFCGTDAGDSWRQLHRECGEVHALAWVPH
jgi:hypothetical protein